MQNQNRAAVFGFAVRSPEKSPLFVQAQSGTFFRSLFLHLFQDVWISSFTGRRPDHMRGLEAVCVQKFCRFPDNVLRAMSFGRRPVKEGHNKDWGKGRICFLGKVVVGKGINEALLRGENFFIISITACCRYRSDSSFSRRTVLSGR